MKKIHKGKPPRGLLQYQETPGATYKGFGGRRELRESLLQEQGYLCCYCMGRIDTSEESIDTKIDHWASRKKYPHLQLDYNNLLGACLGNEGAPEKKQHCDTSKDDTDIKINPADPLRNCEQLITYSATGEIHSADPDIERDLNKTLNLNLSKLVKARKDAQTVVIEQLNKEFPGKTWSPSAVRREVNILKSKRNGKFTPFCQYVIDYLTPRL